MSRTHRRRSRKRRKPASSVPEPDVVPEILPEHLRTGQLNVVVFGPGRGEAILLVMPDGSLGVIDGCREPRNKATGAGDPMRELLNLLHKKRGDSLRLAFVCMTHPHDDHYGGLGRLLRAFRGRVDEVWHPFEIGDRYAKAYQTWLAMTTSGDDLPDMERLKGLDRVFVEMRRSGPGQARPRFVHERTTMLARRWGTTEITIVAVGPSARDIQRGQDRLLQDFEAWKAGDKRVVFDPNVASGALLISWNKAHVLLAGDLLRGTDNATGWRAAHACITHPVQVVNVAHHGSREAHDADLWATMNPKLAIVTPFKDAGPIRRNGRLSGFQPPTPEDVARLSRGHTRVVLTTPPRWRGSSPKASPPHSFRQPKNTVMATTASSSSRHRARRNAVAVALNRRGEIIQLTLAGEAILE